MGKSISHVQGKGSLEHNNRKFITNNVDRKRIKDNIIWLRIIKKNPEIITSQRQLIMGGYYYESNRNRKKNRRPRTSGHISFLR